MWAVMALGAVCTIASVFLATAYPQFGLDHLGGHDDAWKGIYSAKNLCGEKTLLFLLPALWLRTRSTTAGVLRVAYIGLLVGVLIMSKALTSCALLIPLIAGSWFVKSLTSFGKRERIALSGAVGLLAVGAAATLAYSYSDIMNWVGKDAASLSGRAPIWHAAFASFSKRPLLGYGYDAFWMGLRGESANIILDPRVAWALGQSQNGFFDSCLQLGAVGLGLVFLMAATGLRNCARVLVSARDNEYCWYASIFALGILYNLDESFLLARDDLFWLLFVGAWFKLRELRAIKSPNPHPTL
jgi:O-antigen ligase